MAYNPNLSAKAAVPWDFTSNGEELLQYVWRSDRVGDPAAEFQAAIVCDGGRWSWDVVADPEGTPVTIASGVGPTLAYCEELVLEAVGKAFPVPAAHRGLATPASKRYTLASGQRIDLARGEGHQAVATLTDGTVWQGRLRVGGWLIELEEDDGSLVRLNPSQVLDIRPA